MNICLFSFSFLPRIGGMEWAVHNLANALSLLGHRVVVLTKKIKQKDIDIKKFYFLEKFGFTFKGSTRIGLDFVYFVVTMNKLLKKYNFEIINFHSAVYSGTYLIKYKELFNKNIKIIATLHGGDIQTVAEIGYGYCMKPKWRTKVINVLKKSDSIISISDSVKGEIEKLVPDQMCKVYDIPNGVWVKDFTEHKVKENVKFKFNIPQDAKVIISVGRNHIKKGFQYAIQAMKIITKQFSNVYYIIIGKNTKSLDVLVKEYNLDKHIILVEEISNKYELIDCYLTADVYLSASLIEGFSLANLEAMAAGLPCVITDVPGNRDVVKNNSGILVPPASPEKIADAIIKILTDKNLENKLRQNALNEVKKYDWLEIAKKYVQVYENTIRS